jgi:hypothetical protein
MRPDLSHNEVQQAFHAALWGDGCPDSIKTADPSDTAIRFKVYRNNVRHSLTRALAAQFPVVEDLVGPDFFTAMAQVFIASTPLRSPVLLHYGETFAAFLTDFAPVKHLPYLADVARLEDARSRAYHAADADAVSAAALVGADLPTLRLTLHPSVILYQSSFPAVRIWQAHQPQSGTPDFHPAPDYALVARQPDFSVIVAAVDAATYSVLAALRSGRSLGFAATLGDPTAALTLLLRHGLIVSTGVADDPIS